jgi:hypothetical protein
MLSEVKMKLRFTIVFEHTVEDLVEYEATTLEEAAKNQLAWIEDGTACLPEFIPENCSVKVEPIHD